MVLDPSPAVHGWSRARAKQRFANSPLALDTDDFDLHLCHTK
jgi:hypothetical protein